MRADTHQVYQERILVVLMHIQRNLDEAISLEELGRLAHFAPHHFHRIFRAVVGETVMEYARRLRLERAAHQVKFSSEPVTHIALAAGYETHESFTRAFGVMFGCSPSEFRKDRRGFVRSPVSPDEAVEVRIENLDPSRVLLRRHVGPYSEVGRTWDELMRFVAMRGLLRSAPVVVGLAYDDPEVTAPECFRYDACVVVSPEVEPQSEFGVQMIGGGEYAILSHRGPYERMGETYAKLFGQGLVPSGREPRYGPSLEFYRSAPSTPPDDRVTDVCVPLERVNS
jgi:AraC family transcriptional regulator